MARLLATQAVGVFLAVLLHCLTVTVVGQMHVRYLGLDIASQPQEDVFASWRAKTGGTTELNYQTIPNLMPSVTRDLETDHLFDVYQSFVPIYDFAASGLIADITEAVRSNPDFKWSDISVSARDWLTTYKGNIYSAPVDADPLVLYYRRDLISKPPDTWEEMIAVAQQYHGQDLNGDGIPDYGTCLITEGQFGMYPFTIANTVFRYRTSKHEHYLFETNSDDETPMTMNLKTEGWEYVFSIMSELYKVSQGWGLSSGFGPNDAYAVWKTGRCATFISFPSAGSWGVEAPSGQFSRTRQGTTRTPGSTKVFDRATQKLVTCNPNKCPFQEYGNVNRPTYMAGAVQLMIRAGTENMEAALSFMAHFTANVDVRKPGALNPFRNAHWNASWFSELAPIAWDTEDARQYTSALYETMSSERSVSTLRFPGNSVLAALIERYTKEAIRMAPYNTSTASHADILSRLDSDIVEGMAANGYDWAKVEESYRIDVGLPALKMTEKKKFPIWAILLIVIVVLALLVVVAVVLKTVLRTMAAPKEDGAPISVIFVGVKNAPILWENSPDEMPDAISNYQRLVRQSVSASGSYEVKTIGDAFMIVSKSPEGALKFVNKFWTEYAKASWKNVASPVLLTAAPAGDNESNRSGRSTRSHRSMRSQKSSRTARSKHSSAAPGETTFEVSIGIQYGACRVLHDEKNDSYDYRGAAVADAAQCADLAQGGQTITTESFTDAVLNPAGVTMTQVGEKKIGSSKVQNIYQVDVDGLRKKTYKPLTEVEESGNSVVAALDQASGGLAKKRVTVLTVNIRPLLDLADTASKETFSDKYQDFCVSIEEIIALNKGYLHSANNSEYVITFNANSAASGHVKKAVICALDIAKHCTEELNWETSASIVNCNAFVGRAASASSHAVCIAPQLEACPALCGMCSQFPGVSCLVPASLESELQTCAFYQYLDMVYLPGSGKDKSTTPVLGVMKERGGDGDADEWMYELEQAEKKDPYALVNKGFNALRRGKSDDVAEVVAKLSDMGEEAPLGFQQLQKLAAQLEPNTGVTDDGNTPDVFTSQGQFYDARYQIKL